MGMMIIDDIMRRWRAYSRYHSTTNQLSRLDDRTLADIGINRYDIPRVAWNVRHGDRDLLGSLS